VALIDGRRWFIDMVARDFEGELAIVEMSLNEELARL
jgi:hypothetical protein